MRIRHLFSIRAHTCSLLLATLVLTGCTRRFFRNQADREVDAVLTEKNCYPAWEIEQYHLPPDPRARFADPTNPDRPPMPPDDSAAQTLAPNPQKPGKAGVGFPEGTGWLDLIIGWDAENRANRTGDEQPDVPPTPGISGPPLKLTAPFDKGLVTNEKPYLITLEQACELALFNSREFQDRREDLYLAALPVTLERFNFTYQFFATEELIREYTGRSTPEGLGNRWRANTAVGFSKLFPTGALLLARFANQVIVNMAATDGPRVVTPSDLSLDFVQPLLRAGGRAVTLEPLTQTERDLVYSIRGYARFRKEFFVAIAGGLDFGNNFALSSPLQPTGAATTEGFLPTLLRAQQLQNQKQIVAYLERIFSLYKAIQEGGDVSQLQVDQVELDLLNRRAELLQQTQFLRDALDRFKIQLGVPPTVPLDLDDSLFRPLRAQQERYLEVVTQFEDLRGVVNRVDWPNEPELLRARLAQLVAEAKITAGTKFRTEFSQRWAAIAGLTDQQLKDRARDLATEANKKRNERTNMVVAGETPSQELLDRLEEISRAADLIDFELKLRRFLTKPWEQLADPTRQLSSRLASYRDAAGEFVVVLGEARNERLAQVRQRWPDLPASRLESVDLINGDLDQATAAVSQAALNNRFDLMNARARVVDAWRQIAVRANALFGVLDVRYHVDSATAPTGTQPFDFRPERTRHQLILNGELPLVRQAERNAYRTALIAFQRSRRTLQQAEDRVLADVRSELRQLRFLAENYKIQQRAVELAYFQVENSLNVLQAPPRVTPAGQSSSSSSDSGSQAALTQQLLSAVSRLLQAQNQLNATYQSYLVTRYQLYRDLELMNIDRRGVWIDDASSEPARRDQPAPGPAPVREPERLPEPRILPAEPAAQPPDR